MSEQHAQIISIAEQRAARRGDEGAATASRPRCAALTTSGRPCRNYAVVGDRCRVHAAAGHPAGDGGPARREPGLYAGSSGPSGSRPSDERRSPQRGEAATQRDQTATGSGERAAGRDSADAFAWAQRELARRGFGRAVDGLAVLREVTDDHLAEVLRSVAELLRRRLTGEYTIDEFGFDEDLTTSVLLPLLRPLHRYYWRVTSHGTANLPSEGAGLLVANHAGTLPADALITRLDVFDASGRHARELGADLVFATPVISHLARKGGATLASGDDADRLLAAGELVAVWPEGYKGLGKP
ncbi:MAG: 1-acyl-sn-glycerol-3-phosphate acyltransferase, partial [Nitriliruptoraceae bacterium]